MCSSTPEETAERIEPIIRELIKKRQEAGIEVRNRRVAEKLGSDVQAGSYYSAKDPKRPLDILGAIGVTEANVDERAGFMLGISGDDALELEAGFEGWHEVGELGDSASHRENPFYKLGRKIGKELEDAARV